ncbi:glutaredoxin family protein [Gammaproteobacteria bacterium]|nr:glutaredoxin family protein [Gammaproteobacteria bacterium]
MKATLLTTSGCHLCELANSQLEKLRKLGKIDFIEEVEIANSEKLMKKYGASIPVIKINEHELYWPFELQDLEIWVKRLEVSES